MSYVCGWPYTCVLIMFVDMSVGNGWKLSLYIKDTAVLQWPVMLCTVDLVALFSSQGVHSSAESPPGVTECQGLRVGQHLQRSLGTLDVNGVACRGGVSCSDVQQLLSVHTTSLWPGVAQLLLLLQSPPPSPPVIVYVVCVMSCCDFVVTLVWLMTCCSVFSQFTSVSVFFLFKNEVFTGSCIKLTLLVPSPLFVLFVCVWD